MVVVSEDVAGHSEGKHLPMVEICGGGGGIRP